jgi:predicted porin
MKKSLIALAAFAAVGVASAQVTVYGKLDAGVSKVTGKKADVGLNGWETSRFGVKGEQKAGDLTLSFKLEGQIGDTDGNAAFSGFNRVATVAVAGSFGTISMGTDWTPFDNAISTSDALGYTDGFTPVAALGAAWKYDLGNTEKGNAAKSIQYTSPNMNGFQAMVMTAPVYKDSKYNGLGLNYAKGPLTVNFANQSYNVTGATKSTANVLAAQYDLGVATVSGGIVNAKQDGKDRGYVVGVSVPVGADSVSVGFSTNKATLAGLSTSSNGFAAQYIKSLNKSAAAYAGVRRVKIGNATTTKTGLGISYNF